MPQQSVELARLIASAPNGISDRRLALAADGACNVMVNGKVVMEAIGTRIDETGTLIRDGGAFYLRRELGGRYRLELHRTPVDLVQKQVRLVGTLVGNDVVNADGVAPA